MTPTDRRYAKTHEWLALNGDVGTIGISDFAVKELTDLVYMGLPNVGKKLTVGVIVDPPVGCPAVTSVACHSRFVRAYRAGVDGGLPRIESSPRHRPCG